jgi:hypothetical protein
MNEMARSLDSWIASLVRSKIVCGWRSEMSKPCAIAVPISPDGRRVLRIALTAEGNDIDVLNRDIQAVFGDFLTAFGKAKSEVENGRQSCQT